MKEYYCNLADRTIKQKRKRHKSLTHRSNENKIINRNYIQNPIFFKVEKIIMNFLEIFLRVYTLLNQR